MQAWRTHRGTVNGTRYTRGSLLWESPAVGDTNGRLAAQVPLYFANLADHHQASVLDLPDPLLADPEFFADLLQRVLLTVQHAGTHPENVRSSVVQIKKLGFPEGIQPRGGQVI